MARWSEDELIILKEENIKEKLMKRLPGRTWESIKSKRLRKGFSDKTISKWTPEEVEVLNMEITVEEMAVLLPERTLGAIKTKRLDLGHKETMITQQQWTKEEVEKLIFCYSVMTISEMTSKFNRSWSSIRSKAMTLGLKRYI